MTWAMAEAWVERGLAVLVLVNDDRITIRTALGCVFTVWRGLPPGIGSGSAGSLGA